MAAELLIVAVAGVVFIAGAAFVLERSQRDAVAVVTVFLVAVFGLRRQWVVGPLGGIGTPAMLTALFIFWLWCCGRVNHRFGLDRSVNPIRISLWAYAFYQAVGYAVAHSRALTGIEASGSNRQMIVQAAHLGIALLIADGVHSRERLLVLLRRLVVAGAFLAAIGIIAFFTGFDIAAEMRIPGLTLSRDLSDLGARNIFNRPSGTAQHPIEFSVVLGMILPVALTFALEARGQREKERAWLCTGLIAAAVPMSVSRSGIVALLVVMLVLSVGWSWRRRANAAVVGVMFAGVMWAMIPGLLGTIRNLFTRWGTDSSIQSRIDDFPTVMRYVMERPWLGIGTGTYNVEQYLLLDNSYYGVMIVGGFIGLGVLIAFLLTAIVTGLAARSLANDHLSRQVALALVASMSAATIVIATFDAFHYRIFTATLYIVIGSIGALWRLAYADAQEQTASREAGRTVATRDVEDVRT